MTILLRRLGFYRIFHHYCQSAVASPVSPFIFLKNARQVGFLT